MAVAGAVIGIDPFDQPDVEASKVKTRALTSAFETSGSLTPESPVFTANGVALYADPANAKAIGAEAGVQTVEAWFRAQLRRAQAGDYIGLLAYIDRSPRHIEALQALRRRIGEHRKVATVLGFRPQVPALHRPGLQGRPQQRGLPADHPQAGGRSRRAGPQVELRRRRGGRGARRLRGSRRARPAAAAIRPGRRRRWRSAPPGRGPRTRLRLTLQRSFPPCSLASSDWGGWGPISPVA